MDVGSVPPSAEPSCGGAGEAAAPSPVTPASEPLLELEEEGPVCKEAKVCNVADEGGSPSASEQAGAHVELVEDGEGGSEGGAAMDSDADLQLPMEPAPVSIRSSAAPAEQAAPSSVVSATKPADKGEQPIVEAESLRVSQGMGALQQLGVVELPGGGDSDAEDRVACDASAEDALPSTSITAVAAAAAEPASAVSQEADPKAVATAAALGNSAAPARLEQPIAPVVAASKCTTPQLSPRAAGTSQALAAALSPRSGPGGGLDLDEEERVVEAAAAVLNLSLPQRSSATKRKACPASPAGSARQQQPRLLASPAASRVDRDAEVHFQHTPAPPGAWQESHAQQGQAEQLPVALEPEEDADAAFLALEAAAAAATSTAAAAASTPPAAKPAPYSPLRDAQPALFLRQSHQSHQSHQHQQQLAQSPQPPGSAWRPLAPQEQEVMDTLQQLPAVIGSLSEEYQRYIRERALELTRIIDENLQRQGCGSGAAGAAAGDAAAGKGLALSTGGAAGAASGRGGAVVGASPLSRWTSGAGGVDLVAVPGATPSKEATAAAALLLTVAVNKTRWPYCSLGGAAGCASCGGAGQMTPLQAIKTGGLDFGGGGDGEMDAQRPFLSPGMDIVTPLVLRPLSHEQEEGPGGAAGAAPDAGAAAGTGANAGMGAAHSSERGHHAHVELGSGAAPVASYSMCMGSALATSQVAEPGVGHSPELTSGAFSVRGAGAAAVGATSGLGAGLQRNASGREQTPVSHASAAATAACAGGGEAVGGSACGSTAVSNCKPNQAPAGQPPHQQQFSILQKLQPHLAKLHQQQKRQPPPQQQPHAKAPPRGLGNGLGSRRGTGGGATIGKYAAPAAKATGAGKQAQQIPQFKGLGLDLGSLPYLDPSSTAGALGPKSSARNNGNNGGGTNRGDLSARAQQPPLSARSRAGPAAGKPGYAAAAVAAQRAENLAELEQKRRRILAAASAKARQPPAGAAAKAAGVTGADGPPLSHRSRPTGYAAAAAAGLSAYQQLLRRVSSGGGGGPAPPAPPLNGQAEQMAAKAARTEVGGGKAAGGGKDEPADAEAARVEALLPGLLWSSRADKLGDAPYSVVHAYAIMAPQQAERRADAPEAPPAAGAGVPPLAAAATVAPLHTAFKLQDLLPGLGALRAGAAPAAPQTAQAPPGVTPRLPEEPQRPALQRVVADTANVVPEPASQAPATAAAFSVAAVVDDRHQEPATGFVIISRRATREVLPDMAVAAGAGSGTGGSVGDSDGAADPAQQPVASQLDLRSLLPPPAWQRASRTTTPERLQPQPQPRPSAEPDAAAALRRPQQPAVAPGQMPVSMTARSVFAGAGGASAANLAASGRRWQLDADRNDADPLMVPDREQIQHSSPVRPRYTAEADSHASPLTGNLQQQQAGPAAAAGQRPQPQPPGRGVAGQPLTKPGSQPQQSSAAAAAAAAAGRARQASRPARGQSAGPRPWGAGNGGAKRAGSAVPTRTGTGAGTKGARSQSAPRAHPGAQTAQQQQQAPGTPCRAPSSPPPPMQSCTPAHLQQQPSQQRRSAAAVADYAGSGPGPVLAPSGYGVPGSVSGAASPVPQLFMDGVGASGLAGAVGSSPRTPTNRRMHVTSPEDMPLSAAAQHIQARLAAADAAGRSTGGGSSSAALIVTAGSTLPPPPQAVPPPPAAVVASSLMGAASYRATAGGPLPHKPRSTPAALTPQQLRGGACTAAAAGAVAAGRPGFNGFHSSTTTAPGLAAAAAAMSPPVWRPAASAAATAAAVARAGGSPGAEDCVSTGDTGTGRDSSPQPRGLGHDATPNILSPPRNYDRPWAAGMAGTGTGTPSREPAAAAASPATAQRPARPHHQGRSHNTPTKASGPTASAMAAAAAAAAAAPPAVHPVAAAAGSRLQHASGPASSVAEAGAGAGEGESLRASAAEQDYAWDLGAMASPTSSIQQSAKSAAAAQQHQQQVAGAGALPAKAASGCDRSSGRAVLSPRLIKEGTASLRASGSTSANSAAALPAVSAGAVQAESSVQALAGAAAGATSVGALPQSSAVNGSYTSKMLARQAAAQQQQSQRVPQAGRGSAAVGSGLAAHASGAVPDLVEADHAGADDVDSGAAMDEAALEEEERRLTMEVGLLPPPLPTAAPTIPAAHAAREPHNRSSGSRSAVAASAPRASAAAASLRGGVSGLGSLAASFATAGGAAGDGRVGALLAQAAWPGLQSPTVEDALFILATGIAVLDPLASSVGAARGLDQQQQQRAGDDGDGRSSPTAIPTGCFAIFRRGHHGASSAVAAKAVASAAAAAPAGAAAAVAAPVLLRVQVGEDGAVQLLIMRARRSAAPGGGAVSPAEQRVRVAALTCMQPAQPVAPLALSPLLGASISSGAGLSSGAAGPAAAAAAATAAAGSAALGGGGVDDADPSSRWLQLVCMDGGLLRLSACSPADHARLVLGLNAALALAGGMAGADAPLAEVALRGLGAPTPPAAAT
ncbi:hypothetical protein HYH02_009665 [Chlamydomonas schloesseri]|uniref:PpiC domain-containing protein n=1 Tax=Chlamydomonas schloesseri TaxID=2026947 RepID=A0A835TAZ9_9CHLO|nr:hypothetical protein HYH02_009665 [Chlamydomonas schloesseri]|eukprot:KAG2442177.1 hypothetical protein HYH02_009665 [Chlamydomonas schloesseri]